MQTLDHPFALHAEAFNRYNQWAGMHVRHLADNLPNHHHTRPVVFILAYSTQTDYHVMLPLFPFAYRLRCPSAGHANHIVTDKLTALPLLSPVYPGDPDAR